MRRLLTWVQVKARFRTIMNGIEPNRELYSQFANDIALQLDESVAEASFLSDCVWISHAGLGMHASFFDGRKEGGVVAFGLVRIRLGKVGDGLVKRVLGA